MPSGELQLAFYYLGVALAIGLLIGVERGWKERDAEAGQRVAGVRTHGLIGLLGGCSALLGEIFDAWILALGFVGLSAVLATVYVANLQRRNDVGITSLVAGLLTYVLGALAASGEVTIAAAAAVVTTLLLSYKPLLHRWLTRLQATELRAGIKLLLISVVLLPILPNQSYGPWQALNPFVIWWLVVLIAAISFIGYFAIKIGGARRGAVFTGLFGGLASSTVLTLHFARMVRQTPALAAVFATGILVACGTMFPRMLLVSSLLEPALFKPLLVPAVVMAACTYGPAIIYWRSQSKVKPDSASPFKNPLELTAALSFGLMLTAVMLLSKALQDWFGDTGVLALAAASGVADVDAITLSLARMIQNGLALETAVIGIVLAAAVNSLVKAGIVCVIGGLAAGLRVGLPLLAAVAMGLLAAWLGAA